MLTECTGLVIRVMPLTENDKLLTLLTAENGKTVVAAKGSCSIKSRQAASAQLFCYSNYILYEKSGRYWVREADLIENFYGLREDISRISLASYICDVANDTSLEGMSEDEMLRLVLNCLYAAANTNTELDLIKAAFEWRLSSQLGFEPAISRCSGCGSEERAVLDIMGGQAYCPACASKKSFEKKTAITKASADAAIYVSRCDIKKLLSFNLTPDEVGVFSAAGERYLLNHIERSFDSLDFYKSVKL